MQKLLFKGARISDNVEIEGFLSWNHDKTQYFIGRWIDISSHGGTVKKRIEERVHPQTVVMDKGFVCDFLFRGKKIAGNYLEYGYHFWDEEGNAYIGWRELIDGMEEEKVSKVSMESAQPYTGRNDIYNKKIFARQRISMRDRYGEMSGVATYYSGAFYFDNGKMLKNFNKIAYITIEL